MTFAVCVEKRFVKAIARINVVLNKLGTFQMQERDSAVGRNFLEPDHFFQLVGSKQQLKV